MSSTMHTLIECSPCYAKPNIMKTFVCLFHQRMSHISTRPSNRYQAALKQLPLLQGVLENIVTVQLNLKQSGSDHIIGLSQYQSTTPQTFNQFPGK